MFNASILAFSIFGSVVSAPLVCSQDLSRYREFQFGTDLLAVAKQAHIKPSEAKVIHQRPAMIQELKWQAPYTNPSPQADSVKEILFSFYNGELFRMVVTYDPERVAGMTTEDIVNLFQPAFQSSFGMVMYSKRLDALARTAIVEAVRLDQQEAPQRGIELRKKKDEESRAKQEKARRVNKAPFRP